MLAQGAVVLALLVLAQTGASSSNSTALPNVDGLWAGHGSIGIGIGTTFSFASEAGAAGVEALIGGFLLPTSTCIDSGADERAEYAAPWSALKLATNATAGADTLKTVTRLASVARETGSVAAADWRSDYTQTYSTLKRVTELPGGAAIDVPNAYTGCVVLPTAAAAEVAGGPGSMSDGSHVPVVPSQLDELPALASPGPPPFLRGYFASPSSVGVYSRGGYSWAFVAPPARVDGRGGRALGHVQGHFLSHECTGAYEYRGTLVQVNARVNGDNEVEVYCETGRMDPGSGVLQVWLGNAAHCPKPVGEPSYWSVKIGKLVNSPDSVPCEGAGAPSATSAAPGGAVPNGAVPNGAAPNGVAPIGAAPNGVAPNGEARGAPAAKSDAQGRRALPVLPALAKLLGVAAAVALAVL